MESPQQATLFFFAPVAVAYLAACVGWLAYERAWPRGWPPPTESESNRPWLDLALCVAACAGILAIGQVYRAGWLLPTGDSWQGRLGWTVDNLIIYSPLALMLLTRRQSAETMYLSAAALPQKIVLGLLLGLLAVACYLTVRGEQQQFGEVLSQALAASSLVNFLPVFLEGVALAYGFVRLRWAIGTTAAVLVPGLIFALAHVPRQIAGERTLAEMAAFFAFNAALVPAILYTVHRSRDVIWIGIVHYLMDIAIRAFDA